MDKIWLKNYQLGVSEKIDVNRYHSLVGCFQESCKKYSKHKALSNFGTVLTYAELERKSSIFAAYLQEGLGLVKGDRFAIMMPNLLQYPIALYGALRAGLVVVNVNPFYTQREFIHQINDAQASALIVLENFSKVVAEAKAQTTLKHVIVTRMGDLISWPKRHIINFVARHRKSTWSYAPIRGEISLKMVLQQGRKMQLQEVNLNAQDLAFLQYTGGTTGVAKGVMLTHGNIIANLLQTSAWIGASLQLHEEIIISPLPLYHAYSLLAGCLLFLFFGACIVLITDPRNIKRFVKEISKTPFTGFIGINTLFAKLLENKKFRVLDFKSMKVALGGGMAMDKSVTEQWENLIHVPMLQGYGLTEASPVVTVEPMARGKSTGSVGLPLPSTEVSIRDEDGEEVMLGEVGELWVKGPQVMQGYWRNETETKQVLTEGGWLHTGDIAHMDDQGYIYLVDRQKDMIIVSGFNVYPSEIEEVINMHPGVECGAVIGVPDDKAGERVKAFIIKKK